VPLGNTLAIQCACYGLSSLYAKCGAFVRVDSYAPLLSPLFISM